MADILKVHRLSKRFGAVRAVDGVDLAVGEGEILGLIGPNGSGKTTLFSCMTGFLQPSDGRVLWNGDDVTNWPPHRIARSGLVRTFQQPMLFASASAVDNVKIALGARPRLRDGWPSSLRTADDLLKFCGLAELADAPSSSLPYGNRRRLGLAIALAAHPKVLLLDEPAAGLNDEESAQLGELLRRTRDAGVTIVVVDHDMAFLLPLAERVVVMNSGRIIAEGTPEEIQRNAQVIEAFLGEKFAEAFADDSDSASAGS